MNARFDLLARAAAGGLSWRQALRERAPRPRSPGADADPAFDHLARTLAEELPRREALRRLGGGLAAALLASLGLETASAQGRGKGNGNGNGNGGQCPNGRVKCRSQCCPTGASCVNGACVCPDNGFACGAICCPAGAPCCNGQCCQVGQVCCPGPNGTPICTTLGTDSACANCYDQCAPGSSCVGSTCVCADSGQPVCGGTCCPPTACNASGHFLTDLQCDNGTCVYTEEFCENIGKGLVCDPLRGCICPGGRATCGPESSGLCCADDEICCLNGTWTCVRSTVCP